MASVSKNVQTKKWEFVFDYYDKKLRKRRQVKRRGFDSRREANDKMIELQSEVQTSQYVGTKHTTLNEFTEYWLDNIRKMEVGQTTFYNNQLYFKNHIKETFGKEKLQRIDLESCQQFVKELVDKGLARNSIDRICTMLKRIFDKAIEYEIININYMRKVTLPKQTKNKLNIWTLEQTNEFLNKTKEKRYHCVYALALLAGLRQGEILGLRWQDVDFVNKKISIIQTLKFHGTELSLGAKTTAGTRRISIPNQLVEILEEQKKRYEILRIELGDNFVDLDLVIFNLANGKTVFPGNLVKSYTRDVKQAKLPHIRFHDLRHSHATLLLSKGINIKVISSRLGHSKTAVTLDTYSHVLPSMEQEVTDTLEEIITL
ncbi:tyrosine-type recombinase/integrase [Paenibacillus sp. FSL R7-0163]|uniref:site-specific integrase n=1 Tax=Paenibacillus sp. FSL R7-0163 TaxID=2954530 RepID=UPI0030D9C4CF